jgi:hypothetical protein
MTVPDVVGLPFHVARDVASDAGVTLANPDPDGPPIAALAWPGLFYITAQDPLAGAEVGRWSSVRVEVSAFGTSEGDAIVDLQPSPPSLRAHAKPDKIPGEPRALEDGDPSGIRTRVPAARGRNPGSTDRGE